MSGLDRRGRVSLGFGVLTGQSKGGKAWYPLERTDYNQSFVEISARWIAVE